MFTYPKNLIPVLIRKWGQLGSRPHGRISTLPSTSELKILLDVSFYATFLTEEGRHPGFRIIHYPRKEYRKDQKSPYFCFRLLPLDVPRPYTISEVNRLAPAAELTRLLLCIDNMSNDLQKPELYIWAMLDVGENWWKFIHHEVSGGMPPPDHLTITSSCPGELTLSVQGDVVMTLRNGQIFYPARDVLWSGPIADFLKSARRQLYKDALDALKLDAWDPESTDEDYPQRFYNFFLERILFYVRQKQHGGAIIIVPSRISKDDTRLTDRVNIKYPCSYDYAWGLMIRSLTNFHKFYDLHFPMWDGKQELTTELFKKHHILAEEEDDLDEFLGDAAQAIAALTSVDGAVLMTDRLHVIGFGVEVIAVSPSLKEITVSTKTKSIRTSIDSYGTRHRAAFRFCSSLEDSVAFVVSRDGGVKAVKRVGSEVFLWPDINAGSMGL